MNHAGKIGAGNSAGFTSRHPIFREIYTLPWLKERVGFLVSEEAGLQLDISAIVIRKCVTPVQPIGVHAPGPDFFGRKLAIIRKMRSSRIRAGIPYAHEILTASMGE